MAPHAIISYDGTAPDRDGLALGELFADSGASLTLAYVRHAPEARVDHELIADVGAEGRLRDGAARLDDPSVAMLVVMHPSTAGGLSALVLAVDADMLVFGSECRTPAGRVGVGRVAESLLDGGPAAIAVAPAGFASGGARRLQRIGVLTGSADEAAIETAYSLAARHDATVTDACADVDLIVVGSRPHAAEGRVMVSARTLDVIAEARAPVLVTARGVPLSFETLVTV